MSLIMVTNTYRDLYNEIPSIKILRRNCELIVNTIRQNTLK